MALVGQVGEYVDGKEEIASYIERVELCLICGELCQGRLQSCYVSSVYRNRCIWRAAKFVSP